MRANTLPVKSGHFESSDLQKQFNTGTRMAQKITYPCGCELIGEAPMPIACPTHGVGKNIGETPLTKKQKVSIALILDESGSMATCLSQTLEGVNGYMSTLGKDDKVEYLASLTKFDGTPGEPTCREVYLNRAISTVAPLSPANYAPRGSTPMYDAIGQTVGKIDGTAADKFLVVIVTDGEENASREWTQDAVRKLIAEKEALGNWTFVYLGADQNAWAKAQHLGMSAGNTLSYNSSHTKSMYANLATRTSSYGASAQCSTMSFFAEPAPADAPEIHPVVNYTFSGVPPLPAKPSGRTRGGAARMAKLTEEERREFAKQGAAARWGKDKP